MKNITEKTLLKQGDKVFRAFQVDECFYWVDNYTDKGDFWCIDIDKVIFKDQPHYPISIGQRRIIAQSSAVLEDIPVISLDSYIIKLGREEYDNGLGLVGFISGYKSNPNQYTLADIQTAINLARGRGIVGTNKYYEDLEIFDQINNIGVIEVDKKFNVISL
jgi:hypothetical protein